MNDRAAHVSLEHAPPVTVACPNVKAFYFRVGASTV
jgi:hypothetical protein